MNSGKAAAVAMSIVAIACRHLRHLYERDDRAAVLCGLTAKLQIVGFVVELSRAPCRAPSLATALSPRPLAACSAWITPSWPSSSCPADYLLRAPRAASARGAPCPAAPHEPARKRRCRHRGYRHPRDAHAAARGARRQDGPAARLARPAQPHRPVWHHPLPLFMLAAGRPGVRLRQARAGLPQQPQTPQARRGSGERGGDRTSHSHASRPPSCTQRTATSTPACPLPWHHRS